MKLRRWPIFCVLFLVFLPIGLGVYTRADAYTFTAVDVPGAIVTVVTGVNDRGDVVGWYRTRTNGGQGTSDHGFLLANGEFTTIDAPGSAELTVAYGINNRGDIVGIYIVGVTLRGFLLSRGAFTTIDCGPSTEPRGINDHGDIVGRGGSSQNFLFSKGKCTSISVPSAVNTFAFGVNNAGHVVGFYDATDRRHGFLLVRGKFTNVDPPDAVSTEAIGINDRGDIVGFYDSNGGHHGFVFSKGQFTNIDVPFQGAFFTNVFGINNSGAVGGEYDLPTPGFPPHGFVAIP